jgi:hypothetical protein
MTTPLTTAVLPNWVLADLAKSGTTEARARQLGFEPIPASDYQCRLDISGEHLPDGYVIPFRNPQTGELMTTPAGKTYERVKLQTPTEFSGENGEVTVAKYLSPLNGGQHAYILPEVHQALQQPSTQVVMTEGEKKAVAATDAGIPMIGLVGNWGFWDRTTRDVLPELQAYFVKGRVVVVVWDSDAATNYDFVRATDALNNICKRRECKLRVKILPYLLEAP